MNRTSISASYDRHPHIRRFLRLGQLSMYTLSATVSVYSVSVYSLFQWIRLPAYIGPRPPSAPSKLSISILYAYACVSAKTFHDAVPAGSIGKFHPASITSPSFYMFPRLACAGPVARMPPLLLRSNTRPRASESSVTFHCIGRCLSSSFAVITRLGIIGNFPLHRQMPLLLLRSYHAPLHHRPFSNFP